MLWLLDDQIVCVSFFLFSIDVESPIITAAPNNTSVSTDPGEATASVSWTSIVVSENSGSFTVTSNFQSGDDFEIGDTVVIITVVDPAGNSAVHSFIVAVKGKLVL